MTVVQQRLSAIARMILAGGLAICATAGAFAGDRDRDRDRGGHEWGFGSHPTLPVPGALIFGGIAVAAAAAAARRRKPRGDKTPSNADHQGSGAGT